MLGSLDGCWTEWEGSMGEGRVGWTVVRASGGEDCPLAASPDCWPTERGVDEDGAVAVVGVVGDVDECANGECCFLAGKVGRERDGDRDRFRGFPPPDDSELSPAGRPITCVAETNINTEGNQRLASADGLDAGGGWRWEDEKREAGGL